MTKASSFVTRNQTKLNAVLFAWQMCGLVAILAYSAYLHPWSSRAPLRPAVIGCLLAGGVMFVGFIVGLLFGIPKSRLDGDTSGAPTRTGRFLPNTNLEQISDWLTKILVGVGLAQIGKISDSLWQFAGQFAGIFGADGEARAFVITLVLYFTFCGFMSGYFWTRTFLARAFASAQDEVEAIYELEAEAASHGTHAGSTLGIEKA
jgi:hypothetical protein